MPKRLMISGNVAKYIGITTHCRAVQSGRLSNPSQPDAVFANPTKRNLLYLSVISTKNVILCENCRNLETDRKCLRD